jgi:RHS repeat-associated protein
MQMPGRSFSSGSKYRYGFNGQEKDNSTGEGNLDFGARIYDSRLGRWLSVDSKTSKYPMLSPYTNSANNPIVNKDLDGRDYILSIFIDSKGQGQIQIIYNTSTTIDNKNTVDDAMKLWHNLNGSEIKINDIPFKVNFITTVAIGNTFDEAKKRTNEESMNFYSGNINPANGEVVAERTMKAVFTVTDNYINRASPAYRQAETTANGSMIYSKVVKIVPDLSSLTAQDLTTFASFISSNNSVVYDIGKAPSVIAHEIGHTFGLSHNGNYNGGAVMPTYISPFDPNGVMSNSDNPPTISDIKSIIQEALNNGGNTVFKSECQLIINIDDASLRKMFPSWDGKEETKSTQANVSTVEIK